MEDKDSTRLKNLENKIDELEKKIDLILNLLKYDIKENCNKMGKHIDFVENVYDNVKNPLGYLCNTLNYYNGNKTHNLDNK
tara:strand:- start:154 stop:396 length:243 start_codon:yes stop_codon:yes gene_type:complete